ncbi:hypothetical protein ACIPIN_24405 [Pseudomonas sp. NPDC087697]|uniref:hypothetical protein n=1 Tax=Pseudomonas sp. NPDC087697 TaxID=3364447 RepID=UPI00381E21F2
MLIDTEAPLDVLHEADAYRIRTATQLLESLALSEGVYSELSRVMVTSLGDDYRYRLRCKKQTILFGSPVFFKCTD